jgi:hypothetical protein
VSVPILSFPRTISKTLWILVAAGGLSAPAGATGKRRSVKERAIIRIWTTVCVDCSRHYLKKSAGNETLGNETPVGHWRTAPRKAKLVADWCLFEAPICSFLRRYGGFKAKECLKRQRSVEFLPPANSRRPHKNQIGREPVPHRGGGKSLLAERPDRLGPRTFRQF